MIPKECKRLAEVDFPIAVVSQHAAREKSIRHGHPSTLHLWWARRPLAACRAMLLGLLLPDPCDKLCPPEFRVKAREIFKPIPGLVKVGPTDQDLRKALLKFIGDFANWNLASDRTYLEAARQLVKAAHPEETPLVVDPFAGGGSIPLEALRLGCDAFASDLNPVACLILKVLLEDIPRHGPELAEELRRVGAEVKKAAEKELAEFYPPDSDGARPIAYLWARTVRCETPNCGAEIPLVRSFWLSKKANRRRALRPKVVRQKGSPPTVEFEIFEPLTEKDVRAGTVSRAKATCLCCNTVLPPERVRAQLYEQRGGAEVVFDGQGNRIGGAQLLTVVTLVQDLSGRHYRLPAGHDYAVLHASQRRLASLPEGACPQESIPPTERRRISVPIYGMGKWSDLFNARQKLALLYLANSCDVPSKELRPLLALATSRVSERLSTLARWDNSQKMESIAGTFSRHAVGMVWDYAEQNPFAAVGGNWDGAIEWIARVCESTTTRATGQVEMADAARSVLPGSSVALWFTDPPYYDSVPYAHLADYFYVWLHRALRRWDRLWLQTPLSPKEQECVVDRPHTLSDSTKTPSYYEAKLYSAMKEGRRVLLDEGIGCVVFAHKTTEGWETLLTGMLRAGWTVTASWPITTEMSTRVSARDTASLAASVHLVCRPRPEDAAVGDWGEVLHHLPHRVGEWMQRLQMEGVHGADLVFACIGPALEIFSRYSCVETAEGEEIRLDVYLQKVWEVVGRSALEEVLGTAEARARNGAAGALEEDARLTALFLWTLQSTEGENTTATAEETDENDEPDEDEEEKLRKVKGFTLVFDVVRRFAQPLGIHLETWEGRIVETKKGVVRLLPVAERAEQLFGKDGAGAIADRIESSGRRSGPVQGLLFPEPDPVVRPRKGSRRKSKGKEPEPSPQTQREVTTLDRVHAAMLLQTGGRANALRALLQDEIRAARRWRAACSRGQCPAGPASG